MISVEEAKKIIAQHSKLLPAIALPLLDAAGCVIAQDVVAAVDSPPFDQSAMDGYGFALHSINDLGSIAVSGVVAAGETQQKQVPMGTAVRIFTGAPVPEGVDTVVMQEDVSRSGDSIAINSNRLIKGSNIRFKGSQISAGEVAVKAGTRLTPGVVGYLAGLGVQEVIVYVAPKIGIIVTGSELVNPGEPLQFGQIYESNSYSITAVLFEGRMEPAFVQHVGDDEEELTTVVFNALKECDVLLITGGVSVGEFDYVTKALSNCAVETLFHKVNQKPGKPLLFARKGDALVFGLPGNPSSVLTCFYEYVVPCIRQMTGLQLFMSGVCSMPLAQETWNKTGKTCFLKGKVLNGEALVLDGQESYKLNAFTDADCLVVLDSEQQAYKKGDLVTVHKINECWQ